MTPDIVNYIIKKYGDIKKNFFMSEKEISNIPEFLPEDLRYIYFNYGRVLLDQGILQICNPDDFKGVLELLFAGDQDFSAENCFAYCFSAFGTIYFLHKEWGGGSIEINEGEVFLQDFCENKRHQVLDNNLIGAPFIFDKEDHDYLADDEKYLFKRAVKKLGPLEIGECYGFVPTLAMGGEATLENLKRLKAAEHFSIVAQTMNYNLIHVEGYGKSSIFRPIGEQN